MSNQQVAPDIHDMLANASKKVEEFDPLERRWDVDDGWFSHFAIWDQKRFNLRAVAILLGVVAAVVLLYFPVRGYQEGWLRRSALAQARASFDAGQVDQALNNLDVYLETWPNDLPGLELRGELAAKLAISPDQVMRAIQALDCLLRLDPDPPARQDDRKRLVELSIRMGDMVRAGAFRSNSGMDKFESRYRFANKIAERRIALGADDGEAHRLLAVTLERVADSGDEVAGAEAIKEYKKALRLDPGDFASADRLAFLRIERKKDQAGADQILDSMIKARPESLEGRLVRARHLLKTGREERAKVDLDAASRIEPGHKGVRLLAASLAIRRDDPASARQHLAAIPEDGRDDPRLDILSAQVEFLDRRPDRAIEKLRAGLFRTSGTDRELTWRLAYWLIQLNRTKEARPLIAQFRRLVGRPDHGMARLLEGMLRERSGRHASAIIELTAALDDVDGEWKGELELALGRCREALGDLQAAEVDYRKARDLSPSAPAPRLALARLLQRSDPDRAVAELEEALRLAPGDSSLLADLASAQVARQQAKPAHHRDWSLAEAAADRAVRARPDDPEVIRALAIVLTASGRLDEADQALERATWGNARTSEDTWLARSQFLERQGKLQEALRVLEKASRPDAAGDKVRLRLARASLLARTGHGRASLALLAADSEKFPINERAMMARDKANLLAALGDRAGARLACMEWASLVPEDPGPGLQLIEIAQRSGSAEEMEQGVRLLREAVGDDEPVAIAARAIAILVPINGDGSGFATTLDEADSLAQKLQNLAPLLPVTSFVRALLAEQGRDFEEAIAAYKRALKGDTTGLALPRLVALLTRLKRTDDLAVLKEQSTSTATASAIDRFRVREALGSGDKEQAEALLARLVQAQPDSLEYRADLARVLRDLGKPDQAEKAMKSLVDRKPDRPQPWLALLALQLDRGDRPAALATVERFKLAYKGDRPGLLLARCLWAIGDRESAVKVCERELARQPDDLETIRIASEVEEAVGRTDRAEALLAKARAINPDLAWSRRRLALILAGRANHARWAEARSLMETSSADSPEDRMIRALILERGPDPATRLESITVLRSLVEDLPATHRIGRQARFHLAERLLVAGDPAGASRVILPATAESAAPEPATLALAVEALALDNKVEEARRLLGRLVEVQPNAPPTVVVRALVLKAEGDVEGAGSSLVEAAAHAEKLPEGERLNRYYFDQLARIGPVSAAERLGRKLADRWPAQGTALARFLAARDRVGEALETAKVAAEAGPAVESLLLIQSLDVADKLDEAGKEKARALAISAAIRAPKDGRVLAMTTSLLRRHRSFGDETALYGKILAVDPSNIVARNNLAWVLAHDLNRATEALVEVDRVIRQAGPLPAAVDTRGMILAKLGRVDEAITELEKSAKGDPSAIHHIHLARAYAQAGRVDDRRRALEAARLVAANLAALEPEDRAELEVAVQ